MWPSHPSPTPPHPPHTHTHPHIYPIHCHLSLLVHSVHTYLPEYTPISTQRKDTDPGISNRHWYYGTPVSSYVLPIYLKLSPIIISYRIYCPIRRSQHLNLIQCNGINPTGIEKWICEYNKVDTWCAGSSVASPDISNHDTDFPG